MAESQTSSHYDESAAYVALHYSYAAYCQPSDLQNWNCKFCNVASSDFEMQHVISANYLQAFIGFDGKQSRIVISFRGTHNYEDWITDLEYKQIPYPNPTVADAYVHEGFFNAYSEIRESGLLSSLQTLLSLHPNTHNLLITGHSMGGALAELCALDLVDNNIIADEMEIDIYTFGGPRWANKPLAQYFNALSNIKQNWRIVNDNDPVPIVPGTFLGEYGFFHTTRQVLYTNYSRMQYVVCDASSGEDPSCAYDLWSHDATAHLWYLNVHENCNADEMNAEYDAYQAVPTVSETPVSSTEEQTNEDVKQHSNLTNFAVTQISLLIMVVGCVLALVYHACIRKCQRMYGYDDIPEYVRRINLRSAGKKKPKKVMKAALLDA
eukprot:CAMPEP_0197026362 /NCGR_PEP_ID=MMETSP1384-20130603/6461_1 /TAXON_ID=29189 /ORGANISM="Ammonia sp." /LENGTH=379 /DNA_ID=CAMNT_0042455007 /DNA_START=32 /DNA_END=1171 /DNA_ORIENTATION=+